MNVRVLLALFALSLSAAAPCRALDVEVLIVGERDGAYFVEFEAVLGASAAGVIAVLTDYVHYSSLDPRIAEARIVGESDGWPLLFTRLRGCLGSWFCRDMDRYERIVQRDGLVAAESVPGMGDLERGLAETHIETRGERTHIRYRTEFEPSFWMPRWLVRKAMLETLETATRQMFLNVEARAQRGDHP